MIKQKNKKELHSLDSTNEKNTCDTINNPSINNNLNLNDISILKISKNNRNRVKILPYEKTNIKWATLVHLLMDRATSHKNKTAYIFIPDDELSKEEKITYRELHDKAVNLAVELQQQNIVSERILLMYPPGLEFIIAFFGCLYAGAIPVPAYQPKLNRSVLRLQTIASDTGAKAALTTKHIIKNLHHKLDHVPDLKKIPWLASDTIAGHNPEKWLKPDLKPDNIAFLQYTSGSTSDPRGVIVSHYNVLYNQEMIKTGFGHSQDTIFAGWLPLFHDMGLILNIIHPLYLGILSVIMPPASFVRKPVKWLQAISKYKATSSGGPDFSYELCIQKVTEEEKKDLDLSSWTLAFNGAEPIHNETLEKFYHKFKSCGFKKEALYPCYGMAETTLFTSGGDKHSIPIIYKADTDILQKNKAVPAGSSSRKSTYIIGCGTTWLAQKIRIIDPATLTQSPENWIGEIWIHGPNVTLGYWNKPVQTQETFQAYTKDSKEGPYLRTGDLGFLSEDGELFITGRIKDLIVINGKNHYPQDIEITVEKSSSDLVSHGSAAFHIQENKSEKLVVVSEVKRTSIRNINIKETARKIYKAVTEYHDIPASHVVFIKPASLPKTSSGKIQRNLCKTEFLNNELRVIASSNINDFKKRIKKTDLHVNETEASLVKIWEEILNIDISIYDDFICIGGNSLAATMIISRIRDEFYVELTFNEIFEAASIAKIARIIDRKQEEIIKNLSKSDIEEMLSDN